MARCAQAARSSERTGSYEDLRAKTGQDDVKMVRVPGTCFLTVLCVSCCGVQVQIDMEQAWKGLSLVGMAEEARCTAAQAGFGLGCMAQWSVCCNHSQVNALATDAAAAKRNKVLMPFTEKGSLKAFAPFWCMRKEPDGLSSPRFLSY